MVKDAAAQDPEVRGWIGRSHLPLVGMGASTVVFGVGRDRVLRVTPQLDELELDPLEVAWLPEQVDLNCETPALLLAEHGGDAPGWPVVFGEVYVEDEDTGRTYCLVLTERVSVEDAVPKRDWLPLLAAVDAVVEAHALGEPDVSGALAEEKLSAKAKAWATELYEALMLSGRWKLRMDLDDGDDNFGLTRDGRAVWVDFGV